MPKQNTSPANYPHAVLHQIELLARYITIARKRRGETQSQWAKKLGVSQPTMARIERGDPAVAMASYVMCMWLVNPDHGLAELIAPLNDLTALEREVSKASQKRRAPRPASVSKRADASGGSAASVPAGFVLHEPQPANLAMGKSLVPDALADARKTLAKAKGKIPSTAEGLAALLLKQPPKTP